MQRNRTLYSYIMFIVISSDIPRLRISLSFNPAY